MGQSQSLDEVAYKGDTDRLRRMLARGARVNEPAKELRMFHRFPLHAAVLGQQATMVEALLAAGAMLDARDDFGRTPLHYAVRCSDLGILSCLLDHGADYTLRDKTGSMPVHVADKAQLPAPRERLLAQALEHSLEFCFFEGGNWVPFDDSACKLLGFELGEGVAFAALRTEMGSTYVVDFESQMQINVESLFCKSVCWRVLPRGEWNRPPKPSQGLHEGSQDPRQLAKYDRLLQDLAAQGVSVSPVYMRLHAGTAGGTGTGGGAMGGSAPQPPYPSLGDPAPQPSYPFSAVVPPSSSAARPTGNGLTPSASSWDDSASEVSEPCTPLSRPPRQQDPEQQPGFPTSGQGGGATSRWVPAQLPPPVEEGGTARVKRLRVGTVEYDEVVARFIVGMQRDVGGGGGSSSDARPVTVTTVQRIMLQGTRVEAYNAAREELSASRGDPNEQLAWHGASKHAIDRIVERGFGLSKHTRNGRLYGEGIYLSPEGRAYTSAEFASPDGNGEKHLMLCLVVLGSIEAVPVESSWRKPSNVVRYDSGADNMSQPSRFIVWEENMNDYILPTHIVSFRYC